MDYEEIENNDYDIFHRLLEDYYFAKKTGCRLDLSYGP